MSERKKVSITLGVLLIILGGIAVLSPVIATLVLIRVIAWLLIFAAIDQFIHAIRSGEGGVFIKVLLAVLYAVAGVILLSRPLHGAIAATAVIGALLIVDGIIETVLGARLRHTYAGGGGWLIGGGILSLILGAVILYRLPWSMAAIGLLVGIRLIFKGIEQIARSSTDNRVPSIEHERRAA